MHVHVICGDGEAKFWLEPKIVLAKNHHLKQKQIKNGELLSLAEQEFDLLTVTAYAGAQKERWS